LSKRKTQEEFVDEVKSLHPHLEVIGKYQTAKKPISMKCSLHDYVFDVTPGAVLKSVHGCKLCAQEYVTSCARKTHEQFVFEIGDVANKVIFLEQYHDMKTKVKVKCAKCGHVWDACPDALMAGNACKPCAMRYVQNLRIKSHEQFMGEIRKYNLNWDTFDVISKYQKDELPITCKCKICGRVWETRAHQLIDKRKASACPDCYLSRGEAKIRNYLKEHNIDYDPQKRFDGLNGFGGRPLRFDFFLPSENLLIEYQGEFHDGSVGYQSEEKYQTLQEHDRRKKEYVSENGIDLLEIWYWDFNRIEDILSTKLQK